MLQNSKRDVFSIVTEYVEVRQSFLFAFVELIDTVRFYLSHCLPIYCFVTKHDEPFKKSLLHVLLRNNLIVKIFHENILVQQQKNIEFHRSGSFRLH